MRRRAEDRPGAGLSSVRVPGQEEVADLPAADRLRAERLGADWPSRSIGGAVRLGYRWVRCRRARCRRARMSRWARHELRAAGRSAGAALINRTRRPAPPDGLPVSAGPIGAGPAPPMGSPGEPSRRCTWPTPQEVGPPPRSPARAECCRAGSTREPGVRVTSPMVNPIGSGRSRRRSSSRASPSRSERRIPSARQTAASTSDEASLRPRSTSDRYGMETPAAAATSRSVRPCRTRSRRNTPPMTRLSNDMLRLAFVGCRPRGTAPIMPVGAVVAPSLPPRPVSYPRPVMLWACR